MHDVVVTFSSSTMCVQYIGGRWCSAHRGISLVHQGDIVSTSGDTMSTWGMLCTLEDTMSTSGGYHEYIGGIS